MEESQSLPLKYAGAFIEVDRREDVNGSRNPTDRPQNRKTVVKTCLVKFHNDQRS